MGLRRRTEQLFELLGRGGRAGTSDVPPRSPVEGQLAVPAAGPAIEAVGGGSMGTPRPAAGGARRTEVRVGATEPHVHVPDTTRPRPSGSERSAVRPAPSRISDPLEKPTAQEARAIAGEIAAFAAAGAPKGDLPVDGAGLAGAGALAASEHAAPAPLPPSEAAAPPAHRPPSTRPSSTPSLSALLPPRTAAQRRSGEQSSREEAREDDDPILVVEDFSPEALFDRSSPSFHARVLHLRVDTVAVSGFVGAILVGIAFMLGRGGSLSADSRAAPPSAPAPVAAATVAETARPGTAQAGRDAGPEQSRAVSASLARELEPPRRESVPGSPAEGAVPPLALGTDEADPSSAEADRARSMASPAGTPDATAPAPPPQEHPASQAPGSEGYSIMAIGGIFKKSADEVAKFLVEKGFKPRIVGSGDNWGVIVGPYAERETLDRALKDVKTLTYKDGRKCFAGAYVTRPKRHK